MDSTISGDLANRIVIHFFY